MPDYVVERLVLLLNKRGKATKGARIMLVGLAYKKNSGDIREAPSTRIIDLLTEYGAEIFATDPHVGDHMWPRGVKKAILTSDALHSFDAALILTDHDDVDLRPLANSGIIILDTKNVLQSDNVEIL